MIINRIFINRIIANGMIANRKKAMLLTGLVAVGLLTGCSLADIREDGVMTASNENEITNELNIDVVSDDKSESESSSKNEDSQAENQELSGSGINTESKIIYDGEYVAYCEGVDTIYIVDATDQCITSLVLTDFAENQEYENTNFIGYTQGIYYFLAHTDDSTIIMAYEQDSSEVVIVCEYSEGENVQSFDIYKDKIYITTYTEGSKNNKYSEDVFAKEDGELSFTQEEGELDKFFSKIKVDEIITNQTDSTSASYRYDSVARSIDEYGFVLASNSNGLNKVGSDGKLEKISINLDSNNADVEVVSYDARFIIINADMLYKYDMLNGSIKQIGNEKPIYLGFEGGYIYYAENVVLDEVEYYYNYKYDPYNDYSQEIYNLINEQESEIVSGVTGYFFIDNHPLFLEEIDGNITWVAVYYDEAGATYKNLECYLDIL